MILYKYKGSSGVVLLGYLEALGPATYFQRVNHSHADDLATTDPSQLSYKRNHRDISGDSTWERLQ